MPGPPYRASDDPSVVVNDTGEHIYTVKFSAGHLSFADRSWAGKNVEDIEAVIGALTALAEHGGARCQVSQRSHR